MTLEEQLKLERYKLVTDRQKYFTELAKNSFASYIKVFTYLCAGAITLVSTRLSLQIDAKLLLQLIKSIAILVTFLGVVSILQIIFCLKRWYGFHQAETEISDECPKAEWWAMVFRRTLHIRYRLLNSCGMVWLVQTRPDNPSFESSIAYLPNQWLHTDATYVALSTFSLSTIFGF